MYEKLINFLKKNHINYREMQHESEGCCEAISKIRGNKLEQAAKCLVVMVKRGKERYYYLAVVPADRAVDLQAIMKYANGDGVMLAPPDRAFNLTGCEMGTVLPFSFDERLKLIVDPSLKNVDEIVFNAGRLDLSLFMSIQDYLNVSAPMFVHIIK
jgi:Ala-tRNA(Pro) deacylase